VAGVRKNVTRSTNNDCLRAGGPGRARSLHALLDQRNRRRKLAGRGQAASVVAETPAWKPVAIASARVGGENEGGKPTDRRYDARNGTGSRSLRDGRTGRRRAGVPLPLVHELRLERVRRRDTAGQGRGGWSGSMQRRRSSDRRTSIGIGRLGLEERATSNTARNQESESGVSARAFEEAERPFRRRLQMTPRPASRPSRARVCFVPERGVKGPVSLAKSVRIGRRRPVE
jgi:hypothetical protein